MKKILITGSTGMLGSDLIRTFTSLENYDVYGLSRTFNALLPESKQFIIDLADPGKYKRIDITPDVIIHTAALTDLTLCETNPALAQRINAEGTRHIATISGEKTLFIYISTDSIFDGKKGEYSESDSPNPLNAYARSKFQGERTLLQENKGKTTILRTNIYGFHVPMKNSLAEWAYREWIAEKKISGFTDIIFNAVFTNQLATIIRFLIDNRVNEQVLNVGSSAAISKYEFLEKLQHSIGIDKDLLVAGVSKDYPSKIERPRNTSLSTSLLGRYCPIPDFDSGIRKWINQAKAYGLLEKV